MGAAFCPLCAGCSDGVYFVGVDPPGFAVPKVERAPVGQASGTSRASNPSLDAVALNLRRERLKAVGDFKSERCHAHLPTFLGHFPSPLLSSGFRRNGGRNG